MVKGLNCTQTLPLQSHFVVMVEHCLEIYKRNVLWMGTDVALKPVLFSVYESFPDVEAAHTADTNAPHNLRDAGFTTVS